MFTTGYGSSRPCTIVPAHPYTGGNIGLIALTAHIGCYRHKLPPTVAGHKYFTIEDGNGSHRILVVLTVGITIIIWKEAWPPQGTQGTACWEGINKVNLK